MNKLSQCFVSPLNFFRVQRFNVQMKDIESFVVYISRGVCLYLYACICHGLKGSKNLLPSPLHRFCKTKQVILCLGLHWFAVRNRLVDKFIPFSFSWPNQMTLYQSQPSPFLVITTYKGTSAASKNFMGPHIRSLHCKTGRACRSILYVNRKIDKHQINGLDCWKKSLS